MFACTKALIGGSLFFWVLWLGPLLLGIRILLILHPTLASFSADFPICAHGWELAASHFQLSSGPIVAKMPAFGFAKQFASLLCYVWVWSFQVFCCVLFCVGTPTFQWWLFCGLFWRMAYSILFILGSMSCLIGYLCLFDSLLRSLLEGDSGKGRSIACEYSFKLCSELGCWVACSLSPPSIIKAPQKSASRRRSS